MEQLARSLNRLKRRLTGYEMAARRHTRAAFTPGARQAAGEVLAARKEVIIEVQRLLGDRGEEE